MSQGHGGKFEPGVEAVKEPTEAKGVNSSDSGRRLHCFGEHFRTAHNGKSPPSISKFCLALFSEVNFFFKLCIENTNNWFKIIMDEAQA